MKKLMTILAIITCCLFCINVKAEDYSYPVVDETPDYELPTTNESSEENIYDILYAAVEYIKGNIEYFNSWFKEGESPNIDFLFTYFIYQDSFDDFITNTIEEEEEPGEWGFSMTKVTTTYLVPAEIFEDVIKSKFNISESVLNELRSPYTENSIYSDGLIEQGGKQYYSFYTITYIGGIGGDGYAPEFIGYKDLGNNIYEAYSYLPGNSSEYDEEKQEWIEYKPSKDDVYKKDYMVECWEYEDDYGCYAVKIDGFVKAKIENTDTGVKYISFEKIDYKDIPDLSELKSELDTPAISTKTEEVNMNAPEGAFINGTKVTIEKQTEGNIFDVANKALKEKFASFVIYEINAKAGDYNVEPNGKVEISIKVPEGYQTPVIYYVSEDGKLEKLETKVEEGYAVAYVTHFSTYAIVDEKLTIVEKIEQVVENPKTGIISGVGIVAVAGGCGAYFYNKNKKKNKFPQS